MLKIISKFFLIFFISSNFLSAFALENCNWDNREGTPCLTIK